MFIDLLEIDYWRNFKELQLPIPQAAALICLVGDNGTGKSNILELLAALSHQFGLAPGVETARGNALKEPHAVSARLQLTADFADPLVALADDQFQQGAVGWDRSLSIRTTRSAAGNHTITLSAGGLEGEAARRIAKQAVQILRNQQTVHHVHLDADRGYATAALNPQQFASALSTDWTQANRLRDRSFRPTKTIFDDWMQYLVGKEASAAYEFMSLSRKAHDTGDTQPPFEEPFQAYKDALNAVLPHLHFLGIDRHDRTILFDSAGERLNFRQLSGGERELAFLVGQIVRFGLRDGLFLLDEPELHLNPSLLRNWLQYVASTTSRCQLWVATHSWEAAEVVGPAGTIVLERNQEDRTVSRSTLLESRPLIRVLSSAIGSPAFSLANQRFIYVEGDGTGSERGRFAAMCGDPARDRFIEGGGCTEVATKVSIVAELATETEERLFVGGIIDRDFRPAAELTDFMSDSRLHVLSCHEVENLFLDAPTLELLARRNGEEEPDVPRIVTAVSDRFAGMWILQHAAFQCQDLGEPSRELRQTAGSLQWSDIEHNWAAQRRSWLAADSNIDGDYAAALASALDRTHSEYATIRNTLRILSESLGKEVFGALPASFGIQSGPALERQILAAWRDEEVPRPAEVVEIREFIAALAAA